MENSSKIPTERIDVLDAKLLTIDNSIALLQQSILNLNSRLEEVNTNLTALINNNYTDLNTKITALQTRATNLEARRYITESHTNGTSWYRLYSDKWIEQGGQTTMSECAQPTINLLKTMKDTNYMCGGIQTNISTNGDTEMGIGINPYSTTQIKSFCHYINPNTTTIKWWVVGFAA